MSPRNRNWEKSPEGKAWRQEYNSRPEVKKAKREHDMKTGRKRPPGPASSGGPVGAAHQRERKARPEYVLAKRLGVSVKVAREMIGS